MMDDRSTIYENKAPMAEDVAQAKSAQASSEVRKNYQTRAWDQSTDLRSIGHVERPRRGHNV